MEQLTLLETLARAKIDVDPVPGGTYQRNGPLYCALWELPSKGGFLQCAHFGDWRDKKTSTWWYSTNCTDTDRSTFALRAKGAEESKRAYQSEILPEIASEWGGFSSRGESPYLERKGFKKGLYGCRLEANTLGTRTIVPARDVDGVLWGYQRIFSTKLEIGTDKIFRKGARKKGCFHLLGSINPEGDLYVCEGIATAASVFDALNGTTPVVAAFDVGNLGPVSQSLHDRYPALRLRFCADDDRWNTPLPGGTANPGVTKALEAIARVGGDLFVPRFREDAPGKPTDANDLHALEGLEELRRQLLAPPEPRGRGNPQPAPAINDGNAPGQVETAVQVGPPAASTDGKVTVGHGEARLISGLLEAYGPNLMRQGRDFFEYTGTHWELLDPLSAPDYFKKRLDHMAQGKLKYKDIASAYSRFAIHVPHVPAGVDFWLPNPWKQNFSNGTLSLHKAPGGKYATSFGPHRREDYLVHCHKFSHQRDAAENTEFEASLRRIWSGNPDIESKIKAYYQLLGAALVSAFPKIALFIGEPNTGKSTLIMFACALVAEKYRSGVDPTDFHGFNLHTMAGMLVNAVTDIDVDRPISDKILKQIRDREKITIRRKNLSDIKAPIAAVHLYGANRMPLSKETSKAYNSRMLIFRCESFVPGEGHDQNFAANVFGENPQGVVMRALRGLEELCSSGGHFTVPESSREEVKVWREDQGDLVADFLLALDRGEIVDGSSSVMRVAGRSIKPCHLWTVFGSWVEKFHLGNPTLQRNSFYRRVKESGIRKKTVQGVELFEGLGVEQSGP